MVTLPYAVLRLAKTSCNQDKLTSQAEKCLVQTLRKLFKFVDSKMAIDFNEPWALWEIFGAIYYALRINALMVIGKEKVSFSTIISGARFTGCDVYVTLHPMLVERSAEKYSATMANEIGVHADRADKKEWKNMKNGNGYVWLNGSNGEGVDIFFALPRVSPHSDSYVICVDQRKRVALSLGKNTASDLLEKANILPESCSKDILVRGLCNVLPSYNDVVPEKNCFIVSATNTEAFHASLAFHPAATPTTDINHDDVSYLKLVLNSSEKCAHAVWTRVHGVGGDGVGGASFRDEAELKQFILANFPNMQIESVKFEQMDFF